MAQTLPDEPSQGWDYDGGLKGVKSKNGLGDDQDKITGMMNGDEELHGDAAVGGNNLVFAQQKTDPAATTTTAPAATTTTAPSATTTTAPAATTTTAPAATTTTAPAATTTAAPAATTTTAPAASTTAPAATTTSAPAATTTTSAGTASAAAAPASSGGLKDVKITVGGDRVSGMNGDETIYGPAIVGGTHVIFKKGQPTPIVA